MKLNISQIKDVLAKTCKAHRDNVNEIACIEETGFGSFHVFMIGDDQIGVHANDKQLGIYTIKESIDNGWYHNQVLKKQITPGKF